MALYEFKKGEIIFNEGDLQDYMFSLRYGSVGIYANYGKDNETLLTTVKPGDYFGEMGMIDNLPRSATAVALEQSTAALISDEKFADFFKEKPAKILSMLEYLSGRFRDLSKDYNEACDALDEYISAKEKGEAISPDLVKRMEKIAKVGKKK